MHVLGFAAFDKDNIVTSVQTYQGRLHDSTSAPGARECSPEGSGDTLCKETASVSNAETDRCSQRILTNIMVNLLHNQHQVWELGHGAL